MSTEFGDRAAYDRPLNDKLSTVDENDSHPDSRADSTVDSRPHLDVDSRVEEPTVDEPRVDDKAVINDEPTDDAVYDESTPERSGNRTRLFEDHDTEQFRTQWREVQSRFVDEPRSAVREAESLVSKMMDELKSHIDSEKRGLAGDDADTEELRVAFQRYRTLFDQIVSI